MLLVQCHRGRLMGRPEYRTRTRTKREISSCLLANRKTDSVSPLSICRYGSHMAISSSSCSRSSHLSSKLVSLHPKTFKSTQSSYRAGILMRPSHDIVATGGLVACWYDERQDGGGVIGAKLQESLSAPLSTLVPRAGARDS